MPIRLDIVTVERLLYSEDVDMVIAPGIEGELGILPRHAALMTSLTYGELRVKRGEHEDIFAIGGGFLEVRPERVIILADAAEQAEEIDIQRAEEAKERAQKRLRERRVMGGDEVRAEAALRRAMMRLSVAQKVRRRRPGIRSS